MVTTAQKLAVKRIEQIISETHAGLSRYSLDAIANHFKNDLKEVTDLVKEYDLDKQLADSFHERVVKDILAQAEKEEKFAWAANFAKKYTKE